MLVLDVLMNRPKWEDWNLGDKVQHCNTKRWGTIVAIVPQTDGTCELLVQPVPPFRDAFDKTQRCWASYHIRDYEKKTSPVLNPVQFPEKRQSKREDN